MSGRHYENYDVKWETVHYLACVAGGIRERAIFGGRAASCFPRDPRGNTRAAKPRVKFPPATFLMVFACRPLLSPLITSIK